MIHGFLSLIRGYDTRLSDTEKRLIEAMGHNISPKQYDNLMNRINSINRIKRIDGGREVLFYTVKKGKVHIDTKMSISEVPGVCKFAKFTIKSNDEMTRNSGKIMLINGVFYSIIYENPTEHSESSKILDISIDIINEKINGNDADELIV